MSEVYTEIEHLMNELRTLEPKTPAELGALRIKFLGSKGVLKDLFAQMKEIDASARKEFGARVNELKQFAEERIQLWRESVQEEVKIDAQMDLTAPGVGLQFGNRHPVQIVKQEIISIFERIGFQVAEGPEIEDDWHNFTALNTPEDHPARDMQDTFYLPGDRLLRTHTSPVQIRVMENHEPPIRIITPGRVYRNETISARAHCTFHQVEGLYIAENVSFAQLKQTLLYFARQMFGKDAKIRLRPSYFPFTEPSAELDVYCFICKGKGCSVCKGTGWLEIGGCGMVDPAVLSNVKLDANRYSGFAFGMGIERITMLKFGINDIRLFYENDIRFLSQFKS